MQDLVYVIDILELVLNLILVWVVKIFGNFLGSLEQEEEEVNKEYVIFECVFQGFWDFWKFLENSGIELCLFLWLKFGDVYVVIGYKMK